MKNPTRLNIDDLAAQWAARSLSGEMPAAECAALEEWLEASAAHRGAYERYMEIADRAAGAGDAAAGEALERELYEFARQESQRWRWYAAVPAIAASVAAAAFFAVSILNSSSELVTYATAKGERMEVTLADGSAVSLNTGSALSFEISDDERRVTLSRGEVMFDVVRDIERPFVVTTPTAEVVVLGTRFNVREASVGAVVSVLSGVVQVGAANAAQTPADAIETTLIAGQQAIFTQYAAAPQIAEFNPDTVVSWRRGKAFYENETLANVVDDLNRYFPAKIEIAEAELESIRVTGGFDLTDQLAAVEALTAALSLRAEQSQPMLIQLYRDE